MQRIISRAWLLPALLGLSAAAQAADATLELLARKGLITAEEYAELKVGQKEQASVSLKDGLRINAGDGQSTLQLGVLVQMDAAHFSRGSKDGSDGTELRRARLAVSGGSGPWLYRLEGEFAGTATLTDAYGAWRGPVTVSAGNFKLPYSLESLMSDKNLAFMERSLSSALLPVRAPGIMVSNGNAHGSWAVGLFGEPLSTSTPPTSSASTATAKVDDEGMGLSTRATWAPRIGDGRSTHLGASLHYRVPTQGGAGAVDTLRLSSRPEANQYADRLVSTGDITGDVSSYRIAAVELAQAAGPVLVQGEYSMATVNRRTAGDATFSGGYVQASWAVTGERRTYQADKGLFDGIRPTGSVAWEVAARLSRLDLSDAGINGGSERNASVAVNAYTGPAVKLSLNYVTVLETKGGPLPRSTPDALMLRAQYAF